MPSLDSFTPPNLGQLTPPDIGQLTLAYTLLNRLRPHTPSDPNVLFPITNDFFSTKPDSEPKPLTNRVTLGEIFTTLSDKFFALIDKAQKTFSSAISFLTNQLLGKKCDS